MCRGVASAHTRSSRTGNRGGSRHEERESRSCGRREHGWAGDGRVLAEWVGQVSIIDRDTLPLTAVNRPVVVAVGSGREGRIRPDRLRARVAVPSRTHPGAPGAVIYAGTLALRR